MSGSLVMGALSNWGIQGALDIEGSFILFLHSGHCQSRIVGGRPPGGDKPDPGQSPGVLDGVVGGLSS